MTTQTLAQNFPDWHARQAPNKPAYIIDGAEVSYASLVDRSVRLANLFQERGLLPGDVVALLLPNIEGLFEVAWACQRSGLRFTTVSSRLNATDVAYILQDSGARVLVTAVELSELAAAAVGELPDSLAVYAVDGAVGDIADLRPLLAAQPTEPQGLECEGADLLYSSGTTGRPKGVASVLSEAPLGEVSGIGPFLRDTWGFGPDSVYLSPAPLYHSAPLRFSMTVQRFGGTVVVMRKFDPEAALDLIERYRVTHVQMVPTMFIRILQLREEIRSGADLGSLRAVIHAAAPCPPAVKKAMIDWVGPIVDEYYACTENNLMTLIRSEEALVRPGSVGRPLIGTPHILDDDGQEAPAGVTGEIWSEGGLESTYLNDPVKTAAARNDRGWTTAGDLGYVDADGYLYISDRRDDLIISGGVNIYPLESENVLIGHPAVADVAVIGVPHSELGAEARAVVQVAEGVEANDELAEELLAYCQGHLSRYKCPRTVLFARDVPRTPTGKLMRREVRASLLAETRAG